MYDIVINKKFLTLILGSFLLVENGCTPFIDTGTTLSVPLLLKVLVKKGVSLENVIHVMVTLIHLDHAGGASGIDAGIPKCCLGGAPPWCMAYD